MTLFRKKEPYNRYQSTFRFVLAGGVKASNTSDMHGTYSISTKELGGGGGGAISYSI